MIVLQNPRRRRSRASAGADPASALAGTRRRAGGFVLAKLVLVASLAVSLPLGLLPQASAQVVAAADGERAAAAREALRALKGEQLDDAVRLLTAALADTALANDQRAILLSDRGVAQARIGHARAAIEDFNRAIQLVPESAVLYSNRATVLLELGEAKEALRDLERALQLDPQLGPAMANRAVAFARLDNPRAAFIDFGRAIARQPRSLPALAGRGRLHLLEGRPHAAIRDLTRGLMVDPKHVPALLARAEAQIALERYKEAREDLGRVLDTTSTNLAALLLRGYAAMAARDDGAALKDFTTAVEADPRSSSALEARALAYAKLRQFEDALNDLGRALEVDPRSAQAYAYRGWVYKEMGRAELGRKDVERASGLEPDRAEVLWARGELMAADGQTDQAAVELRRAIESKPLLREAAVALDRLGVAPPLATREIEGAGIGPWRLQERGGRFFASIARYPRLIVPIEMMGAGQPRLLEWTEREAPLDGVGVLRFLAGSIEGEGGAEETEHAAVIDVRRLAVVTVAVQRIGTRTAGWTWEDTRVVIVDPDGIRDEHALREPREIARPVQRRLPAPGGVARYRGGGDQMPSWAPWSQSGDSSPPQQGGQRTRPSQKTLFDLIFKGN